MSNRQIWNHEDIDKWLAELSDGNADDLAMLKKTLRATLLSPDKISQKALSKITSTEHVPEEHWLHDKFKNANNIEFLKFDRNRDVVFVDCVHHIVDWLKAARRKNAPWLNHWEVEHGHKSILTLLLIANFDMKAEARRLKAEYGSAARIETAEDIETVMTFNDGFKIVLMKTPDALKRESAHMQHCVGEGAYDDKLNQGQFYLYSLRSPTNKPHVTMEVEDNGEHLKLVQCRGRQNAPPVEKYLPYLSGFVRSKNLVLGLEPENTGLVYWRDAYHSIYALPEGIEFDGSLDLSFIKSIQLPQSMFVRDILYINGHNPPVVSAGVVTPEIGLRFREKGDLHRADGPAEIVYDPKTGNIISEVWWDYGLMHRFRAPAEICKYASTGKTHSEAWYIDGTLHRTDGPASIVYGTCGSIIEEKWYVHGDLHRVDGPACYRYYGENAAEENWYRDGELYMPTEDELAAWRNTKTYENYMEAPKDAFASSRSPALDI